jgi:hypothetical protein
VRSSLAVLSTRLAPFAERAYVLLRVVSGTMAVAYVQFHWKLDFGASLRRGRTQES